MLGLKQAQLTALAVLVFCVPLLAFLWLRYPGVWATAE